MGAGAVWGVIFLAPELLRGFGALQLTLGRYLTYGVLAALLIASRWRALSGRLTRTHWRALAWLAFVGNTLYYILLSTAVRTGGIAMTALIIGFLPVAVTIVGSRERGAVPLRRLLPSLSLCVAGAVCIGWQALFVPSSRPVAAQITGLFCAIGAVASWTAYAVDNSRWLARLESVSADDWNLLTGVVTGAQSLVLVPVALLIDRTSHGASAWAEFGVVSACVAFLASIVGNGLWNRMSRLLPLTLVGQMILFETLFGLVYGLIWERRLPTLLECVAFVLVVLSVMSCIAVHGLTTQSERSPDAKYRLRQTST
jgi:drug/metabolite transporter (DMT)-like permease